MALLKVYRILLFLFCLPAAFSIFNPDICSIVQQSCGPVPPVLPEVFEYRAEMVNPLGKMTAYQQLYFDHMNSKGKYMFLHKGIEHHFIFDYQYYQIIEYMILHPGVDPRRDIISQTCTASNIDQSPYKNMFGLVDDITLHPKMFNAYQALRFGGQYQYAFNTTEVLPERGLKVDTFSGCLYDRSMDATYVANYSFANQPAIATSGGTYVREITGVDEGVLSVPIKSTFVGANFVQLPDSDEQTLMPFNVTENFSFFRGQPEFDYDTFQIPPWMHCKGYAGQLDIPKFPTAFSTRVEVNIMKQDILGHLVASEISAFMKIYYDSNRRLARRDYTPVKGEDGDIYEEFGNFGFVRTIYDFTVGLVYVTHVESGRCFSRPIHLGEFFDSSKEEVYAIMSTPEQVFTIGGKEMEYKGRGNTRNVECDVWNGQSFDADYNATLYLETYFSTDAWHENVVDTTETRVPIKHSVISQRTVDYELIETVKELNFLKFRASAPPLSVFDVDNCIETIEHKFLAVIFSNDDRDILFKYKELFLETAQMYITDASGVNSPLRVQRLHLREIEDNLVLQFAIAGKTKLRTPVAYGQHGASLTDAVKNLQAFIQDGNFTLTFYPPSSTEDITIIVLPGNLYTVTSEGELKFFADFNTEVATSNTVISEDEVKFFADFDTEAVTSTEDIFFQDYIMFDNIEIKKEETVIEGMSSGSLAMLAIAMLVIGIGIGIAIMYLYVRKMREDRIENMYTVGDEPKQEVIAEEKC